MGKYDSLYFDTEENIVSIWLANVEFNQIPENYWVENYEGEDDEPWNQFSNDFGFGYYNIDSVESFFDDKKHIKIPVFDLLKYLSYSESFMKEAIDKAKDIGLINSSYVYLIYNFKYDATESKIFKSEYFTFLGTFEYDLESKSVENYFSI